MSGVLVLGTLGHRIAEVLSLPAKSVGAVLTLLREGATVPFIARYRKEQTGGLDEVAIRAIEGESATQAALEERRATVLATIGEQGKLTPELRAAIEKCRTRAELEDVYLPYRPKRKTRASVARERGLLPLAERILAQPASGSPAQEAARFVAPAKEVADASAALAGARDIVAEIVAERGDVRGLVRARFDREAVIESGAVKAKTKGMHSSALSCLSNGQLVVSLSGLLQTGARLEAQVLAYLVEVEERRLDLELACSSMFDLCVRKLGMSDGEACRRIGAARVVKRFPVLLEAIAERRTHLTTVLLLREHLTPDRSAERDRARGADPDRAP